MRRNKKKDQEQHQAQIIELVDEKIKDVLYTQVKSLYAYFFSEKLFSIRSIRSNLLFHTIKNLLQVIWNCKTSNLTTLNLSRNLIEELPSDLSNLYNLEKLNLFGNKLRGKLPSEISKLKQVSL